MQIPMISAAFDFAGPCDGLIDSFDSLLSVFSLFSSISTTSDHLAACLALLDSPIFIAGKIDVIHLDPLFLKDCCLLFMDAWEEENLPLAGLFKYLGIRILIPVFRDEIFCQSSHRIAMSAPACWFTVLKNHGACSAAKLAGYPVLHLIEYIDIPLFLRSVKRDACIES